MKSRHKLKLRVLCLIFSFVLVVIISGLNPIKKTIKTNAPLNTFVSFLEQRIPELMKLYNIPGSNIALVKNGKIVWSQCYGYADVDNMRKLTTDTPMRVQSISKSVTAWGIMKLVEKGEIDLDAPITSYLNNWQFPKTNFSAELVTVRQLLSHTAGLPLGDVFTIYSPKEKMPSLEEKLSKEAVLLTKPGTAFSYSNTGYNLLELLIEEVTGRDFAEYMEKEILIPLGMRNSTFQWSEELAPPVPVGYNLSGNSVPVYIYPEKGSGGLFSTAEDIANFVIAGMNNNLTLNAKSIEQLYTPMSSKIGIYKLVFDSYGFGHYMEMLHNGKKAVSHGGQGTGIMTHFHAVPETGDGIVILTNSQRSWPFIAYLLMDWAQWCGFSSIGMKMIIWGKYVLWAVIFLSFSAVLLKLSNLIIEINNRNLNPSLQSKQSMLLRISQAGVAIIIIGIIIWCLCQKYLFITSVFPRATLWLGISTFTLSIVLLVTVMLPMTK